MDIVPRRLIIILCRDLIRDAPLSRPAPRRTAVPRAKRGLAAAVSKSFHRAFVLREYRGKRNLITDFCDKTGSAVLRPTRNKWGKPRVRDDLARGNVHRIDLRRY